MKHSLFRTALAFAVILPAAALVAKAQQSPAQVLATQASNGSTVTLQKDQILVVRLPENASTGYSRAFVTFPDMPISPLSHQTLAASPATGVPLVGVPKMVEWKFRVEGESKTDRAVWLKFLNLRPFAKGVETSGLWEIKVVVPPTTAE